MINTLQIYLLHILDNQKKYYEKKSRPTDCHYAYMRTGNNSSLFKCVPIILIVLIREATPKSNMMEPTSYNQGVHAGLIMYSKVSFQVFFILPLEMSS